MAQMAGAGEVVALAELFPDGVQGCNDACGCRVLLSACRAGLVQRVHRLCVESVVIGRGHMMCLRVGNRGMALVGVLVLSALLMALGLTIAIAVRSDTQLRGALAAGVTGFYAAESGLNKGMGEYRNIETHAPDYQPMAFYSSDADEVDPSEWLASIGGNGGSGDGEVVEFPATIGGEESAS